MAAKKPEKPSAKKATGAAKAGATKGAAKASGATKSSGAAKGAAKGGAKGAAKTPAPATKKAATPAAKKPATAPAAKKAADSKAASTGTTRPAGTGATRPAGTGARAVPPERHERARQEPEPRRQATIPPAQQPAAAAANAAPRRLRPTKPTKDMYSAATGTNTADPFPAKELDKFRTLINDIRAESIEELEMLTEQLREMTAREVGEDNNAYSLHMAEQGTDAMEREKTFLQAQRTSDYVKKLGEALDRIENKSFGICRICGLRLDSKRLLAVPVTQVCTVYKNTSKPCEPGRLHMQETGVNEEDVAS